MYREKSERKKWENLVFEAFVRGRYGGRRVRPSTPGSAKEYPHNECITIEHRAMFVVKSINIQINGKVMDLSMHHVIIGSAATFSVSYCDYDLI